MTLLDHAPGIDIEPNLREQLLDAGLLHATTVRGLYGRSATYLSIAQAIDRIISVWARELDAELLEFPPVLARTTFARTNYLESFPDLMGSVHTFCGDEREHRELLRRTEQGEDWQQLLEPTEVVVASAACHPVYPLCRDNLGPEGRRFEISNYCFRHEPSDDPARMMAFHMHEVVYVGTAQAARAHRDQGLERGLTELRALGLEMDAVPANDPFFGRQGKILANGQLEETLKIEGVATVASREKPTAIMSANLHKDHFGRDFEIESPEGGPAHSACVAFGVDRITLALLSAHGLDPRNWPDAVLSRMWP